MTWSLRAVRIAIDVDAGGIVSCDDWTIEMT
jgi:hypothetical protein